MRSRRRAESKASKVGIKQGVVTSKFPVLHENKLVDPADTFDLRCVAGVFDRLFATIQAYRVAVIAVVSSGRHHDLSSFSLWSVNHCSTASSFNKSTHCTPYKKLA